MAVNGIINPNAAASAYSNSQKITGGGNVTNIASDIKGVERNNAADSVSFSDLLTHNIKDAVETMKAGEEMSAKAVTGEAAITDVVQAVTAAELTLQKVVTLRDRMISAYQDIMRMPI